MPEKIFWVVFYKKNFVAHPKLLGLSVQSVAKLYVQHLSNIHPCNHETSGMRILNLLTDFRPLTQICSDKNLWIVSEKLKLTVCRSHR